MGKRPARGRARRRLAIEQIQRGVGQQDLRAISQQNQIPVGVAEMKNPEGIAAETLVDLGRAAILGLLEDPILVLQQMVQRRKWVSIPPPLRCSGQEESAGHNPGHCADAALPQAHGTDGTAKSKIQQNRKNHIRGIEWKWVCVTNPNAPVPRSSR